MLKLDQAITQACNQKSNPVNAILHLFLLSHAGLGLDLSFLSFPLVSTVFKWEGAHRFEETSEELRSYDDTLLF